MQILDLNETLEQLHTCKHQSISVSLVGCPMKLTQAFTWTSWVQFFMVTSLAQASFRTSRRPSLDLERRPLIRPEPGIEMHLLVAGENQ